MPYDIRRNYRGKSGYSVVSRDGKSHGTHPSRTSAIEQQRALYAAEAQANKLWNGIISGVPHTELPETD